MFSMEPIVGVGCKKLCITCNNIEANPIINLLPTMRQAERVGDTVTLTNLKPFRPQSSRVIHTPLSLLQQIGHPPLPEDKIPQNSYNSKE